MPKKQIRFSLYFLLQILLEMFLNKGDCLAPLRSAAKRGINSPKGCLLGGSGSGPKGSKKVEFVSRRDGNEVGSAVDGVVTGTVLRRH